MKQVIILIIFLVICSYTLSGLTFKHHYPMDRLNDFEFFEDGILLNTSGMEEVQ